MSFFKKIGKFVKKGVKQISFKNLVKVGGMIDPTGLVGGMQNAHYEQKAAKEAEAQGRAQEAEILRQQASQTATNAGAGFGTYMAQRGIVQDAIGGAVLGGATAATLPAKNWFQNNWQKLVIGLGAVVTIIVLMRMRGGTRARR
jgi:hypothetical protein